MTKQLWWIIQKDLVSECRTRLVWPRMLLLGLVVAFLFGLHIDRLPGESQDIAGSLCWLTICFAGVFTLGQSIAAEREDGCWESLRLYPVAPHTIFLAKLIVNGLILGGLQVIVIPLFCLLFQPALLHHPGELILVAVLGNLGVSSIGTLLGAMSSEVRQGHSLLALLLLPLLIPVLLAASEATRLTADGQLDPGWQCWVQLLGACVTLYTTAGLVLFEFAIED